MKVVEVVELMRLGRKLQEAQITVLIGADRLKW